LVSYFIDVKKLMARSDNKAFHYWTQMGPKALNLLTVKISVNRLVNSKLTTLRRPISVGRQLLNNKIFKVCLLCVITLDDWQLLCGITPQEKI